ncbi:hypothetical protein RND81_01G176700 [Saponaria officinalis]|uniref:RING-type E3 ubiquitin transferase n=1 Tax=Saponaria officinalis TaxID=3572 RepID=A0AAW1NHY8_SAPOF
MAITLHRKLFSHFTSTPTNNETTFPCSKFCDPTCDNFEDCYTFPDSGYPLPPLPPPLPPISIVVSSDTTTSQGVHISPLVIIIVIVLASLFLLISYYTIVIKYCTCWGRGHDHDPDQSSRPVSGLDDGQQTDSLIHENENHDPVIDHPIWLISTIGLHQSVINAITMLRYKKGDGLIDGTDCSVCLSEFQEGETLRLLPKCKHAFHIDCIDTWLRSHINCPLCRAGIVANSGRPSLGSNEASFGHSRRVEFNPIVDSDSSDVELGRSQLGNSSEVEYRDVNNNNHNNINNIINDNVDQNDQNKIGVELNSIVRRSFSMDFFRGSNTRNVGAPHFQRNDSNSSSTQVMDSTSSSRPQPLRHHTMKRSYSWSERVFWSSRNQNNDNRDICP